MREVLTAAEMREIDRLTTEKYGIPSILLMENAAHAAARVITEKLGGSVTDRSILVLCGKGNNGGDGAALARILWTQGARCLVYLFGSVKDLKGDARINFEALQEISSAQRGHFNTQTNYLGLIEVSDISSIREQIAHLEEDVCVDALLGTGFRGELQGGLREVVSKLNNIRLDGRNGLIVSVDIPSGVFADSPNL